MRTRTLAIRTIVLLVVPLVLVTALLSENKVAASPTPAMGGQAVQRPIEDWVDSQGTFCFGDPKINPCVPTTPCHLFVPPIENFIGWSDPPANICASVDYAGLADAWISAQPGGVSFGTSFSGSITERPLPDGRAEVRVILHTSNALTWVVDGWNYAEDPLLFGHRAPDVLAGADAALGDCFLELVFINTEPGADLPDLMKLYACPEPEQEVLFIAFRANIHGTLREAFGVPDGTPGRVQITQTGLFMTGFHGAVGDGFPAEHIKLRVVGR